MLNFSWIIHLQVLTFTDFLPENIIMVNVKWLFFTFIIFFTFVGWNLLKEAILYLIMHLFISVDS